ncbi:hypothetical protein QA640_35255 [Bradyrhizobium sp. CB82]|uniref:hypothetical protein n=1 Tax=Bradyrhizobium sp. CB82 TaxID=3039159 RepID=UPI0024B03BF3|nr:hypothetical protein [Bradyrhizobium sp. CB82]WFU39571.1 hypothetical protein QA640_35255 [Bradyrhizobium sp. CB82]
MKCKTVRRDRDRVGAWRQLIGQKLWCPELIADVQQNRAEALRHLAVLVLGVRLLGPAHVDGPDVAAIRDAQAHRRAFPESIRHQVFLSGECIWQIEIPVTLVVSPPQ